MNRYLRDLAILAMICLLVWSITRVRLHSRQLERLRAELIYTTDIDDATAQRLLDALQQWGFLNGVPRTFRIAKVSDVYELLVVTNPTILTNARIEKMLQEGFQAVCGSVFAGQEAMVKLADDKLNTFHLLVEPQSF